MRMGKAVKGKEILEGDDILSMLDGAFSRKPACWAGKDVIFIDRSFYN